MKPIALFIIFFAFHCPSLFSGEKKAKEVISLFDVKRYSVLNAGAKNLRVEVKMPELLDYIKEQTSYSNISDVKMFADWDVKNGFNVKLEGFGERFQEAQTFIKQMILNRMDYILPQTVSSITEGYTLKAKESKGETTIEGNDKSGKKGITSFSLIFDSNNVLKEFKSFTSDGLITSYFRYQVMPWSHNKYVLKSVDVVNEQKLFKTEISSSIDYTVINGYGLPKSISIQTKSFTSTNDEPNVKVSTIDFSNYKVNEE